MRNTAEDVADCLRALRDVDFDIDELPSKEESDAAVRLAKLCRAIADGLEEAAEP